MERAVLSHRITSILSDISRLTNALYALNTTDIQRYPDNYEVLSTDCLLYTSEQRKGDLNNAEENDQAGCDRRSPLP